MIRFGTDGWRAVIADDFTFENVQRVAGALAFCLSESGGRRPVAVGYDTRFLSDRFAATMAETLTEEGVEVWMTTRPVPSPCLSFTVREKGLACGIMVTASHNPPEYNGLKFKASYGGSVPRDFTDALQKALGRKHTHSPGRDRGTLRRMDFLPPYLARLGERANLGELAAHPLRLVVDPMHGAAAGIMPELLAGGRLKLEEIRGEHNPGFGGLGPEPIERNLAPLIKRVTESKADLGVAFDGDGDRLGAVDGSGRFVDPHRLFAVMLKHLVPSFPVGQERRVIKTVSTTDMIEKLALPRELEVVETPIGFKHIVPHMLRGDVLMGGEESGGFGFCGHLPERDGVLASLIVLSALTASGATLDGLVQEVFREVGPHCYQRLDLRVSFDPVRWLADLVQRPPERLGKQAVTDIRTVDGLKMRTGGGWVMLRASGTEPILRVYAEASSQTAVSHLLELACKMLPVDPS